MSMFDSLYSGFDARAKAREEKERPKGPQEKPSGIVKALSEWADAELAKEGLTPGLIECVDLDIAFSPVIPHPYTDGMPEPHEASRALSRAVEVTALAGGRYRLDGSEETISAESLRIMRGRYLKAREIFYEPQLRRMFPKKGPTP